MPQSASLGCLISSKHADRLVILSSWLPVISRLNFLQAVVALSNELRFFSSYSCRLRVSVRTDCQTP